MTAQGTDSMLHPAQAAEEVSPTVLLSAIFSLCSLLQQRKHPQDPSAYIFLPILFVAPADHGGGGEEEKGAVAVWVQPAAAKGCQLLT